MKYTSRNGYKIDEEMDSTGFDLSLFSHTIDVTTTERSATQMAKYNYYAALAVQKDFGTDRYMNKLAPSSLLEKHYNVNVSRYISWRRVLPYTNGKQEDIIIDELNEKRPVFLHFSNLKDFGHSVVIDGYQFGKGKFLVHINQGQGGEGDGWYDYNKGILRPDDLALRVIYTFEPK